MKHGIHILFWMLIAALSSCTDDEIIDVPEPQPQTGIVIRLSAGDLEQTRTDLTSQANLHHVQSVYAILYKENAEKSDYDYVTCDDLNWSPKDSSSYGEAQAQAKVLDLPNDINLEAGNYTVLCVGLDDKSGDTYGLTPENMQSFKTLSEAKATLAQNKGKEDIAKSELFAGWNQFHFAPDSLNIVDVEMKRRVAGVLCYLTDVPYELTISGENGGTYRVTKVQVCLYKDQNSEISLLRKEIEGKGYPDDFGSKELANSNVLMEFPLEGYSKQDDKNLYEITSTKPGMAPNSLLGGVYMIPIDKDEQENTIEVKLLGKVITSSGEKPVEEAEEIEIANFPAINDDIDFEATEGSTKNYPIRPNLIYHIGDKPSDEEEGTPESLAGTEVKIGVKCWENETVDVEFPSVPISFGMEIEKDNLPYKTESKSSEDNEYYIFDCVGSDEYCLHVKSSVLYKKWVVTVAPVVEENVGTSTDSDNMIYFKQVNDKSDPERYDISYTHTDESLSEKSIPIAITDYADISGKPTRKIRISVVGLKADEQTPDEASRMSMTVEQYNAIIVRFYDDDEKKTVVRGFSHFDWGVIRDRENGKPSEGEKIPWGYARYMNVGKYWTGPIATAIYADEGPYATDGSKNYNTAKKEMYHPSGEAEDYYWKDSAIKLCAQKGCVYDENTQKIVQTEAKWYLPSYTELDEFLQTAYNKDDANIQIGKFYWSSSATRASDTDAWAYSVNENGYTSVEDNMWGSHRMTNSFYARQCCLCN